MALSPVVSGADALASDLQQFYALLTGTTTDQAVTLKNILTVGSGGGQTVSSVTMSIGGIASQTGHFLSITPSGAGSPHVRVMTDDAGVSAKLQVEKEMVLKQITTPSAPATGYTSIYPVGSDMYFRPAGLAEAHFLTNTTGVVFTLPQINDTSSDHQYVFAVGELTADRTVTLPLLTTADEFVFKNHAVTLTNKTIDGASNTITGVGSIMDTVLAIQSFGR